MERIGEYEIKRLIGEGGMGRVYEAEERLSKRRVALKVLRPELTRSEDGRRLFQNEMQILAQLEHPGLVRSLAAIEHEGQLVMVLEHLEGRTLRQTLADRGRLGLTEAVELTAQIALALGAAHTQSPPIVHRDLKPENVMIGPCGAAKVMDFGVAKVLAGARATSTQSVGTLQYMSPEQLDAGELDARSDLYALGLVLYEMLEGAPPFASASPRELLNLQCTAAPPALTCELPSGIETLLLALLAKAPADRPESAAAVVSALAPFRVSSPRTGGARLVSPTPAVAESHPAAPSRAPGKLDTLALVAPSRRGAEVSTRAALACVVVLSLLAGATTYEARLTSSRASQPDAAASAGR
jgi:serine/threonine-protein kinase